MTVAFAEDTAVPVDPANPAGCKQVEPRPWFRLQDPQAVQGDDGVVVLGLVTFDAAGLVTGVSAAPRHLLDSSTAA